MAAGVPESKPNHQRKRKPEDLADHKHKNKCKSDPNYRNNESEQSNFTQLKKRVRTPGGGITGTARNFRFREDRAKYLFNLDVNSAHYDPKSRSMRGDPNPYADPEETFYRGDNQYRHSGDAMEFQKLFIHAWERGQGQIHVQAAPSQAELVYKNHKAVKEKVKSQKMEAIMEKYGNAACEEEIPRELLLG